MRWGIACLLVVASIDAAYPKSYTLKTQANVPVELTFFAGQPHVDPFNRINLDCVFVDPKGNELRVPGFWAGMNVWRVRYASSFIGTHRFRTICTSASDKGLDGITGNVEVKPYHGSNAVFSHGPLKLASNRRSLEYADGTSFFWLGDTWWMGLCHRLHWPDEFKMLAADRKQKGFNVIQIVAGLYPDMPPFDPRGANETGFPWDTNYTSIRPEYFNAADERLRYLVDQGFTPCIFGAWGHYISSMGVQKAEQHWRYLIARYGAWPVVWCAAGEANLPWYGVAGFPYDDRKQAGDWTEVMRYLRETDPFHRLITVHPTGIHRLSSRNVAADASLFDFDMLQTPHGQRSAVPDTVKNIRQSYSDKPIMPVINGEASYEMLTTPKEVIPADWTRRMFWLCMMNGAAGHTYGANGIWQCNRKGQPYGRSPGPGSPETGYGIIPWDEAMTLPGSQQVAYGKKFFERFPWPDFAPHPEWAEFAIKSSVNLDGCHWIWFPEGQPATNAPAEKRFFRRSFVLHETKPVASAQLRISADDQFTAKLNEAVLGSGNDFKYGKQFNIAGPLLKPGTNVLAIVAENKPAPAANPAGLIVHLDIRFMEGTSMEISSDESWQCSQSAPSDWDTPCFSESGWRNAMVIGRAGDLPWGQFESAANDGVYAPQCIGISGSLRIIYVPDPDAIVVQHLSPKTTCMGIYFDPVTGEESKPWMFESNDNGDYLSKPPDGHDHDWVLIVNEKAEQPRSRVVVRRAALHR